MLCPSLAILFDQRITLDRVLRAGLAGILFPQNLCWAIQLSRLNAATSIPASVHSGAIVSECDQCVKK